MTTSEHPYTDLTSCHAWRKAAIPLDVSPQHSHRPSHTLHTARSASGAPSLMLLLAGWLRLPFEGLAVHSQAHGTQAVVHMEHCASDSRGQGGAQEGSHRPDLMCVKFLLHGGVLVGVPAMRMLVSSLRALLSAYSGQVNRQLCRSWVVDPRPEGSGVNPCHGRATGQGRLLSPQLTAKRMLQQR